MGSTRVDEPGSSASVSHGSKSLRKSSELVLKDGVLVWVYRLIVLLSYHVAAKKARGMSALKSDYGHGLGSA